jgi:hypothetical protein
MSNYTPQDSSAPINGETDYNGNRAVKTALPPLLSHLDKSSQHQSSVSTTTTFPAKTGIRNATTMPAIHTHSSPVNHTGSTLSHAQGSAHHSSSLPNSSTPLFQLINFPSRLVLENVYLNGLHSLRRFGIKNTSPTDIVVKMRSSLGSQISFQLTNENLPFDAGEFCIFYSLRLGGQQRSNGTMYARKMPGARMICLNRDGATKWEKTYCEGSRDMYIFAPAVRSGTGSGIGIGLHGFISCPLTSCSPFSLWMLIN